MQDHTIDSQLEQAYARNYLVKVKRTRTSSELDMYHYGTSS
jgi:hypothetical protein